MMFSPTDICVIVHRAKNLLVKGKSSNDAFATMEFSGEKYATNVVEKSLSPSWHQECQFRLPQSGVLNRAIITITVYNKHHGKLGLQNDDFVGTVKIPLSNLDTSSQREHKRWYSLEHKNPKREKKERGDVEIGFRFLSKDRINVLPDKKSPKNLSSLTSKLGQKLRRRSEDEDSGVGCESYSMKRGVSMDNLRRTPSSASDGAGSKKRFSLAEVHSVVSARGLVKLSNKIGLGGNKTKATSVEVLHRPEMRKVSSATNLKRCGSSGRTDSGNNSLNVSVENLNQTAPVEDLESCELESMDQLHALHNENFSNSKSLNPFEDTKPSSLSIVYKPKSYYRLDVKELCKVSPIPEDHPTVTFQQMDRDELLKLCMKQHHMIADKNEQIQELEDYIDSLLVKVMVYTPQILESQRVAALQTQNTKFQNLEFFTNP